MKINLHGRVALFCALQPGIPQEIGRKDALWGKQLLRTMKLVAIILTACCLQVSAYTKAQVTISVKEVTLDKIFTEIEKQVGLPVMYSQQEIKGAKKVSLQVTNMPVEEVLKKALTGQPFGYRVEANSIFVYKRSYTPSFYKDVVSDVDTIKLVYGRITNKAKEPIVGATIQVRGTSIATISDDDGRFMLSNILNKAILIITSINYQSTEISINGKTKLEVQLTNKTLDLEGVTITYNTGYQEIPAERATGSFSQPSRFLYNTRTTSDVISKLEGVASGLVFNRTPNGTSRLQIRGQSTINADATPLIVIDDFPYDGDVNNINPNDIASVTILKDAAAASIWGARAGNGVIVIKTKRGNYNQPLEINFSSFFSITNEPDLSYNPKFLNSSDFIDQEISLFNQGFYNNDFTSVAYAPISPIVEVLNQEKKGAITAQERDALINGFRNLDKRDQLSKYFYQREQKQQYSLSLSGGNPVSNYIMSVGYDQGRSALVGNKNNRLTTNFFSSYKPLNRLEIYGGINYIQSDDRNNSIIGDLVTGGPNNKQLAPYSQFADANGNALQLLRGYRDSFVSAAPQRGFLNWQYFPLTEMDLADNRTIHKDARLTTGLKFNILKGLSIGGSYQYQTGRTANDVYYDERSYYTRNLINQFSTLNGPMVGTRNIPLGSILQKNSRSFQSNNFRTQLSFSRNLKESNIDAIIGMEWRDYKGEISNSNTLYGYNQANDAYAIVDFTKSYSLFPSGSSNIRNGFNIEHNTNRFRSYFANVAYDYKQRYTLSISGRIDQANLFGIKANDRQVPLWSVGAKWNISNESFYRIGWLSELQTRITWGFSGNLMNNGTAYTTAIYNPPFSTLFPPQYSLQSPGNPELRWEKVGMLNIGLDFKLANNLVSGSLEYYLKRAKDLIGSVPLPSSTGFSFATVNYGRMQGQGIDLNLNFNIVRQKFLTWSTALLFSYATDKITKYEAGVGLNRTILESKPVNSLFAYKWAGLDPTDGTPRGYDTTGKISSDYAVLTLAPANQKAYAGRLNPSVFGAFRTAVSLYGFTLTANLSYKFNYYFLRSSINYNSLYYSWEGHQDYRQRWQKPGDETITNVPSASPLPSNMFRDQFYAGSEALVTKGDHIRLQDAILSYMFTNFKPSSRIKQIQVSMNASNLGILWRANDYKIDPDFIIADYAPSKTLSAAIKATF